MNDGTGIISTARMDSPIGWLAVSANASGVTAIDFLGENGEGTDGMERGDEGNAILRLAIEQLRAYFDGGLLDFDIPLIPEGTPFQLEVWRELQQIPYGETISYGELARRIGKPDAVRAVGAANGRNHIPIIIPCHRVIGSNGTLTGYAGGMRIKQILLTLERKHHIRPGVQLGIL